MFDWVLFVYFQVFYENLMMFWVIFMQKYRKFTNFQAALYIFLWQVIMSWFLTYVLHTYFYIVTNGIF